MGPGDSSSQVQRVSPSRPAFPHSLPLGLFSAGVRGGEAAPHGSPNSLQVSGNAPPAVGPGGPRVQPKWEQVLIPTSQTSGIPRISTAWGRGRGRPKEASPVVGGRPRPREYRPVRGCGESKGRLSQGTPTQRSLVPGPAAAVFSPPHPNGGNPPRAPPQQASRGARGCHLQGLPKPAGK